MTDVGETLVAELRFMHLLSAALEKIAGGGDTGEVQSATAALIQRLQSCERLLDTLPGGDLTAADQMKLLAELRARLVRTEALAAKYRSLPVLAEDEPERGADEASMKAE